MNDLIYILLPVHNRRVITQRFIECLQQQSYSNYHLVLIDDGSTDETEQMVHELVDSLTVIRGTGNWWWAGCLQQGFNFLKKKGISHDSNILIINDDVTFGKEFLAKGISILEENMQTLLLAQFQEEDASPPKETGFHIDLKKFSFSKASSPEEINCLSTRGLFLKWRDFVDIGGFHPTILPHYWSDYEFTIRAHKIGYRCFTSSDVTLSPNLQETGRSDLNYSNYLQLLKSLFSIKTIANPIYQITFICLVCPAKWLPKNLFKILFSTLLINIRYPIGKLKKLFTRFTIKRNIKKYKDGYKIIIGAGKTHYPGWISTEYPALDISDPNSMGIYFDRKSVKAILSEHVFEHLTLQQAESALTICKEYLLPGGYLRIAVPDGFHPDKTYINYTKPGGFGGGSGDHKVLYNYKSLKTLIEKVGLKAKLLEWYDQEGKFHSVDWQPETGFIKRSSRFDERNKNKKLAYTSLIIDAYNQPGYIQSTRESTTHNGA
ncbi:MAG: glycosyltransferase [Desulfobacterales bacterium]|nr:glycosyltransferase [Desulfobacterales bacterium]